MQLLLPKRVCIAVVVVLMLLCVFLYIRSCITRDHRWQIEAFYEPGIRFYGVTERTSPDLHVYTGVSFGIAIAKVGLEGLGNLQLVIGDESLSVADLTSDDVESMEAPWHIDIDERSGVVYYSCRVGTLDDQGYMLLQFRFDSEQLTGLTVSSKGMSELAVVLSGKRVALPVSFDSLSNMLGEPDRVAREILWK
jgi:hypothetical protein